MQDEIWADLERVKQFFLDMHKNAANPSHCVTYQTLEDTILSINGLVSCARILFSMGFNFVANPMSQNFLEGHFGQARYRAGSTDGFSIAQYMNICANIQGNNLPAALLRLPQYSYNNKFQKMEQSRVEPTKKTVLMALTPSKLFSPVSLIVFY